MAPPLIDFITTLSNLRGESLQVYCGKYSYYRITVLVLKILNSTFLVVDGRNKLKWYKHFSDDFIYTKTHACSSLNFSWRNGKDGI